jgi:glycerate dehydrogenase
MNIVVLDGYTLNPGDLNWSELEKIGSVEVYDRTSPEQLLSRAENADIVFTNKTVLAAHELQKLSSLKYIGVLATGYDIVDIEAARQQGITVTNVPGYGPDSVAQMVFAHILNITNNVAGHADDVNQGGWGKADDYCYWLTPQIELKDKVLGIIGYGAIGKATARIAIAFGMEVVIFTRTTPKNLPEKIRHTNLDELLSASDFISLHCPLTKETRRIINEDTLQRMKESAILINCSRGPLVHEQALAQALNSGRIRAACLDVLSEEPVKQENPLIGAQNCYITPHISWATLEARTRLLTIAVDNLRAFLQHKKLNCLT